MTGRLSRLVSGARALVAPHGPGMANRFMSNEAWRASRGTGLLGVGKRVGSEVLEAAMPRRATGLENVMGVAFPAMGAVSAAGQYQKQLMPKTVTASEETAMSVRRVLMAKLEKNAAGGDSAAGTVAKALAFGTGLALSGALIGKGAQGVGSMFTRLQARRMFEELGRRYPEIKRHPNSREYFDLIVAFAPSLLRHPAAIGDFLRRQLQYPMTGIEFIKQLADLEATVNKTSRDGVGSQLARDATAFSAGPVSQELFPKPPRGR